MDYFDNEENVKKLRQEIETWIGTPWMHRTAVKKLGVDCIHFVAQVMLNIGAAKKSYIPWQEFKNYTRDWHLKNYNSLLLEALRKTKHLREVPPQQLKNGDIVIYQYGRTPSHASIFLDGFIYQSMCKPGVEKLPCDSVLQKFRLTNVFRVTT